MHPSPVPPRAPPLADEGGADPPKAERRRGLLRVPLLAVYGAVVSSELLKITTARQAASSGTLPRMTPPHLPPTITHAPNRTNPDHLPRRPPHPPGLRRRRPARLRERRRGRSRVQLLAIGQARLCRRGHHPTDEPRRRSHPRSPRSHHRHHPRTRRAAPRTRRPLVVHRIRPRAPRHDRDPPPHERHGRSEDQRRRVR